MNRERMINDSGLGAFASMRLDEFRVLRGKKGAHGAASVFVRWVVKWWRGGSAPAFRGLFLYGPTGTGKTHLAAAICRELIMEHGVFSMFLPSMCVPRNDQDELMRLADPDEIPVLALDDLGAEKPTPRFLECVQAIIDGRIHLGGFTVVTSNFAPDALRERLDSADVGVGDRVVSRLRGNFVIAPLGGDDMRLGD